MTAGNRIRTLREARGWSLADLTDAFNSRAKAPWHRSVLAKVETGQRSLSFEEAGVLCDVLGVALDDLRSSEGAETVAAHAALAAWQRKFGNYADLLNRHCEELPGLRARARDARLLPELTAWSEALAASVETVQAVLNGDTVVGRNLDGRPMRITGSGTVGDPYIIEATDVG